MGFIRNVCGGCVWCLKAVAWLLLGILNMAVEFIKLVLVVFGLILSVFTSFVRASTP